MQDLRRDWYVVYSKPRKEEQAQFHLAMKGVESFFPRLHLPGSLDKKKRIVPLFPNYLFVHIHLPTEYYLIVWSPGVKKLVTFSDTPIPLDEKVVQFLQQKADVRGIIPTHSQLKRGQEVEIAGGPFDGLLAIIQDPPDTRGRVKILLRLLSRQVSVRLGVEFIKGDWAGIEPSAPVDIGPSLLSVAG